MEIHSLEELIHEIKKLHFLDNSIAEEISRLEKWYSDGRDFPPFSISYEEAEAENEYNQIKAYLDARKNKKYFIKRGVKFGFFKLEMYCNLISEYSKTEISDLIESSSINLDEKKSLIVEASCSECNAYETLYLSKTTFIQFLKDECVYTCPMCIEKKKEEENQKRLVERESLKISKEENTRNYIEAYLNPCKSWNKDAKLSAWKRINHLKEQHVDWDLISNHIKKMDYYEFLKTPYWKAISLHKMKQSKFRCQLCNKTGNLSTHHRDYSVHGIEIHNLNELIVICQSCHEKHHNIQNKS